MTLSIINGGRGSGGTPPRPRRKKRKHWLAEHLWKAVVKHPHAASAETLRNRMAVTTRLRDLNIGRVHSVLNEVREHAELYGWTVAHVAKGADNENRRFIPILVDYHSYGDPYFFYSDDDVPYVKYGLVSSARTIASMAKHESLALDLFIDMVPRTEKRALRSMQATLTAAADMASQVADKAVAVL
jgi:hypothetical protein